MSRQQEIYQDLQSRIRNGEFASGTRLPSVRELAGNYASSHGTVAQAINRLRYEGMVYAKQGDGCFVAEEDREAPIRQVVVCEWGGRQHFYNDFISAFTNEFAAIPNVMVMLEDLRAPNFSSANVMDKLLRMGRAGTLEAVFLDGEWDYVFTADQIAELQKYTENVFCYFNYKSYHYRNRLPAVYTDWSHTAYIAVRHLLEIGCRRILAVTSWDNEAQAMRDAVSDTLSKVELTIVNPRDVETVIRSTEKRFDGIYLRDDSRIAKLLPLLAEKGYRLPEETALVGLYDTPWSVESDLTSVNLRQGEIVKTLMEMYRGERQRLPQTIKPHLVIRRSTIEFKPVK